MNQLGKNYAESQSYESFIRLACQCNAGEFSADKNKMELLMDYEDGLYKTTPSEARKLLSDVQDHMIDAIKSAIKRKDIAKQDKDHLKSYLRWIKSAGSSNGLLDICKGAILLLAKYKPSES
jgi:hypothetical protein